MEQLPLGLKPKIGRCERGVNTTLQTARKRGYVDAEADAVLCALARTLARSADECAANGDAWKLARVAAELRETLGQMRVDPSGRGAGEDDELDALLAGLANPSSAA